MLSTCWGVTLGDDMKLCTCLTFIDVHPPTELQIVKKTFNKKFYTPEFL